MYSIFTWVYGIDLTDIANDLHTRYNGKYSEDELKMGKELEEFEDVLIVTAYAGSGKYPWYVGIDFSSWCEFEKPTQAPIESEISNYLKQTLNEKIEMFKEKCPYLSKKVDLIPKIFLSRSTS